MIWGFNCDDLEDPNWLTICWLVPPRNWWTSQKKYLVECIWSDGNRSDIASFTTLTLRRTAQILCWREVCLPTPLVGSTGDGDEMTGGKGADPLLASKNRSSSLCEPPCWSKLLFMMYNNDGSSYFAPTLTSVKFCARQLPATFLDGCSLEMMFL
jgi:hypothetical protein